MASVFLVLLCMLVSTSLTHVHDRELTTGTVDADNTTINTRNKDVLSTDDLMGTAMSCNGNVSCQSDFSNFSVNGTGEINAIVPASVYMFSFIYQGSVSESTVDSIDYALNIVVLPVLVIMGICGNMASFRTLLNEKPTKPINVYLIGLSITDTAAVTFQLSIWFSNIMIIHHRRLGFEIYAELFAPIVLVLRASSFRASGFITVVLSVERAIAVTFPLKVKAIFLNRHPRKVIVALCLSVLLVHLPYLFQYTARVVTKEDTNTPILIILPSEFEKGSQFFAHYDFPIQIIMRVLPVIFVFLCNIVTIRGIKESQKNRKCLGTNDKEELSLTRLLITITVIFLICTTPFAINGIMDQFLADYGLLTKEHFLYSLISLLAAFLSIFNSCINFIVYMFVSKKFREMFFRTWRCANTLRRRAWFYKKSTAASVYDLPNISMSAGVTNVTSISDQHMAVP